MSATDRSELEGYEALVSELRAAPPVAPERLRQRVLELAPGSRRPLSRRRRLVFVVVPVAVALAVGAALVHGAVSSGSNHHAALQADKLIGGSNFTRHAAPKTTAKEFGPGTITTQAAGKLAAAPNKPYALQNSGAHRSVAIPTHRLVHATASLQVQVKNRAELSAKTNKATQIVSSLGGYAQSVHYESSHQGYGSALLALRVPIEKAQLAIGRLANLGTLLSQTVSTKDLQQRLTHENSGIGSLRRAVAVYVQALDSGTLSASQRVEIQIKLANARHALKQLRRARTGTLQSGATAAVSLLLTTRNHAIVVTHHRSGRFDRLLGSAASFLGLEAIIVLYALIIAGPVLLVGGLAWWLVRERRRREETRLLASA